jgi:hypothetical protein
MQSIGLAIGLGIIAIGFVPLQVGMASRVSTNLCLSLLSLLVSIAMGEGFFRGIGYDFADEEQAWRKIPIYYRQPIVPTGDVFFRRPGLEQWTGQVLNTKVRIIVKQPSILPNPYTNEPVITVEYDRNGFRNPDHLSDWKIAVAGDSFTELGYLPYEQLFTSILAKKLNLSVLNLGTSYTGPLTQLSYLDDYGIAASTKHAMIVFFEGNDLENLANEYKALVRWRKTGQREFREFRKQPSLVRALYEVVRRVKRNLSHHGESYPINAYFKSSLGNIPVMLLYSPPGRSQLSNEAMHHLNYFFRQYADFGKKNRQITLWLAYMPSKRRVLHRQIEFTASASVKLKRWQPTDLPEVISGLCNQHGIKFIDLTPALVRETDHNKKLLYNSVYDTHLNSHGSLVVGLELARHFSVQNR